MIPPIDGVENAVLANEVLTNKVAAKDNVVVIGGGLVGCELALHLAQNAKVSKIGNQEIKVLQDNNEETIATEQTIVAVGYKSKHDLFDKLKNKYTYVYNLGDSKEVRNIRGAIWDAYEVARNL